MVRGKERPLIERAEGRDQDDRAAVASAWLRIWRQQCKPSVTDLHCEQLVLAVFACDRSRTGVQWSYAEIADRLRCPVPTARKVVDRCCREFGLLEAVEERYARSGQAANRYRINWPMVRAINAGMATRSDIKAAAELDNRCIRPGDTMDHPPATTDHPGDTVYQAPDTMDHPYKECPSNLTSIQASISPPPVPQDAATTPRSQPTPRCTSWEEVEEFFVSFPSDRLPGAWRDALASARRAGVTPDYVSSVLHHYASKPNAFGPGALYHRLRHCHPSISPSDGWPVPDVSSSPVNDEARKRADLRKSVERIEFLVCKAARPERLSDDAIGERIALELSKLGIDPTESKWCKTVVAK